MPTKLRDDDPVQRRLEDAGILDTRACVLEFGAMITTGIAIAIALVMAVGTATA